MTREKIHEKLWTPLPGPQTDAYCSPADELFYGGSAGGGKTDLGIGLALSSHRKSIFFRREYPQLRDVIERSKELLSDLAQFSQEQHIWRDIPGRRTLEFGSIPHNNKLSAYKGRPHDLKVFDEASDFTEQQYLFLTGWARTTIPSQRVRIVAMGNPPTRVEGEWVIRRWGPWLDPQHPNPATPGELRWYAMVGGKQIERENGEPFEHRGELIKPRSRTFIPARLTDNPYLLNTDYGRTLQNLPEPLRSQLLYGDFTIGVKDDAYQVIPTEWVRRAQARWQQMQRPTDPMRALGVDVARGGDDKTVLAGLINNWFAPLKKHPGADTPSGSEVARLVLNEIEDITTIFVDVIGVGASVFDSLNHHKMHAAAVNFAAGSDHTDRSGTMHMANIRAAAYWKLREALDPDIGLDVALPPDPELLADLCAPHWSLTARGIQIESKDDIVKRLGRSPDCADAVVLAWYGVINEVRAKWGFAGHGEANPKVEVINDLGEWESSSVSRKRGS